MNVYERKTFIYELDTFPYGIYFLYMVWYEVVSSRKVPKGSVLWFLVGCLDGWMCYVYCVCAAQRCLKILCVASSVCFDLVFLCGK